MVQGSVLDSRMQDIFPPGAYLPSETNFLFRVKSEKDNISLTTLAMKSLSLNLGPKQRVINIEYLIETREHNQGKESL